MPRRHHYRRLKQAPEEINITTFLNLMVVLIPFLLITAVFSRLAVVQMNLPVEAAAGVEQEKVQNIDVVMRQNSIELLLDQKRLASWQSTDDVAKKQLSEKLRELKQGLPDKTDAFLLVEQDIPYKAIIAMMDVMRAQVIKDEGSGKHRLEYLFPDISLGDAP